MKNDKMKNQYRVNEQIRVREVRIVSDGESTVMPTRHALDMAREQGVDLVEISPNAVWHHYNTCHQEHQEPVGGTTEADGGRADTQTHSAFRHRSAYGRAWGRTHKYANGCMA